MKITAFLFLLCFAGISALQAQTLPDTTSKKALKNKPEVEGKNVLQKPEIKNHSSYARKLTANEQIKLLKDGVVLVRLHTSELAINDLKKTGNHQMAATLQRQQEAANQRLVYAFEKQYNFTPVYFFFSSDTEKVKSGATSGYLLNKNLKVDPTLSLPDTNFFIVEITDLEQYRENHGSPQESHNAEVSFTALVIRDRNFRQLTNPFPYFIKASSNFPPRKRSEAEMVDLFNANLISFYKQVIQSRRGQ